MIRIAKNEIYKLRTIKGERKLLMKKFEKLYELINQIMKVML